MSENKFLTRKWLEINASNPNQRLIMAYIKVQDRIHMYWKKQFDKAQELFNTTDKFEYVCDDIPFKWTKSNVSISSNCLDKLFSDNEYSIYGFAYGSLFKTSGAYHRTLKIIGAE